MVSSALACLGFRVEVPGIRFRVSVAAAEGAWGATAGVKP